MHGCFQVLVLKGIALHKNHHEYRVFSRHILAYSDRIRFNTEQNFCINNPVYFLNNFPVYHYIRAL